MPSFFKAPVVSRTGFLMTIIYLKLRDVEMVLNGLPKAWGPKNWEDQGEGKSCYSKKGGEESQSEKSPHEILKGQKKKA